MNGSSRVLWWHYLLAALFLAHCGVTSARAGGLWYAAGLFASSLLFGVALAREYVAADQRRAAAVRAERAARFRESTEQQDLRRAAEALGHACCERWWTSCGHQHDSACTNQRRAA
jgi:hypothetical protein